VVVQLPAKVENLEEEPRLSSNELIFRLLKAASKTNQMELFLYNQPVGVFEDTMDNIVHQMDSLKTGMEIGGTSSASDEEKV
jgi:hypothetical protein